MTRTEAKTLTQAIAGRKIDIRAWRADYEAGMSLEALARREGVTAPTMAAWLRMVGATMRGPGLPKGRRPWNLGTRKPARRRARRAK